MDETLKKKVARSRFELLSGDPESPMIDRYTTGLCASYFCSCILIKVTALPRVMHFLPARTSGIQDTLP